MTWRSTTGETELIILPSDAVTDFMIRGVTSLPPLAIVAIAVVICNGVTPTSCPIGMRVMEILLHVWGGRITPLIYRAVQFRCARQIQSAECIRKIFGRQRRAQVSLHRCCSI